MDHYISLAQSAIKAYCVSKKIITPPNDIPAVMLIQKAGIFVSLHKKSDHSLRGCIGTFESTKKNIAEEIIENAIAAGFGDPRFEPLTQDELNDLDVKVDVLNKPEEITDTSFLNPDKYGLIVKNQSGKSGLLLPDIGIPTVEEQIRICCEKGGIDPTNDQIELYRFTVTRHT